MPAVELAEKGFPLSDALARSLNREVSGAMAKYPASVAAYGKPGGGQWQAGDTIVLADLGRTLRAIATKGPDAFYTGWIADSIASVDGAERRSDHASGTSPSYQAKVRAPVRGKYHGYEIISMPPPTQRRRDDDRDAQHPRELRSAEARARCRRRRCTTRSKRCAAAISIARASSAIPTS